MDDEIEELNCPICMMIFKRPLTISCGHTFCSSCLTNSLREHRNCPICRHHVSIAPAKANPDQHICALVDHYRRSRTHGQQKSENVLTECKAEQLLLVDVVTDDLLLPYNRITATFELQSSTLMDRMERFVARQEAPFNRLSTLARLLHIHQIRKNFYKGVLQVTSFCTIQSEHVESELSLEGDDEEYFYRTCSSREITETGEAGAEEFGAFFEHFDRIHEQMLSKLIYGRIDPAVFTYRNDPLALFYSILGILAVPNQLKYAIATTFDEEKRIAFIKEHLAQQEKRLRANPSSLVHIPSEGSLADKKIILLVLFLILVYLLAQTQDL